MPYAPTIAQIVLLAIYAGKKNQTFCLYENLYMNIYSIFIHILKN